VKRHEAAKLFLGLAENLFRLPHKVFQWAFVVFDRRGYLVAGKLQAWRLPNGTPGHAPGSVCSWVEIFSDT
jgi:glyoxylase-like metal-dependent hydrolase (beta-lactamase superfamily II)